MGLVEILGLPFVDKGSEIITSFLSISTIAGLMTAFDLSASRGLHVRWISIPDVVCVGPWWPPSANGVLLWSSSSNELLEEEHSECESWTWEYLGYLEVAVLLLTVVVVVSVTGSGSEGLEPVDSVSEADE